MKVFLRDNGLTIALTTMFVISGLGMIWSGHIAHNEELQEHGGAATRLSAYLTSGDFLSALFENWESEFLQMSAYVMLTAILYQRGSAESRDPDDPDRPNDTPPSALQRRSPLLAWVYSYSLGIALALLFVVSFGLHWWASLIAVNEEAVSHGGEIRSLLDYLFDAKLWFEVLSELAVRVLVDSGARRSFDLPASQGIARIQAGRCIKLRNRRLEQVWRTTFASELDRNPAVRKAVPNMFVEEAPFDECVSNRGIGLCGFALVVIAFAGCRDHTVPSDVCASSPTGPSPQIRRCRHRLTARLVAIPLLLALADRLLRHRTRVPIPL